MSRGRQPLSFVYGNCLLGSSGPWALFELAVCSYAVLSGERKRELFGRLLAAVEAAEADIQLIRIGRAWDVERYADELDRSYRGPHPAAYARYVAEHRGGLTDVGRATAALYVAISLEEPERDVGAYVSNALERSPRELLRGVREATAWQDRRMLAASELERLRVRADEAHSRIAGFLDVRPARTVEAQWLLRRAFCRGAGEPVVDGLRAPRGAV